MSDTILTFEKLKDYPYNSFTDTLTPIPVGYSGEDPEVRTIPASAPYIIELFNAPFEDTPSTFDIVVDDGGPVQLREVPKTQTPGVNQYRVNYEAKGLGQVEFNSARASQQATIKYYHVGTVFRKTTLWAKLLGISTVTFASTDSESTSQDIADQVIDTSEDAGVVINAAITAMAATGGKIYLFEGTYNLLTGINLNKPILFEGSGKANTKIVWTDAGSGTMISLAAVNVEVRSLQLDGNKAAAGNAVGLDGNTGFLGQKAENLYIHDCGAFGISQVKYADTCDVIDCDSNGFNEVLYAINCNSVGHTTTGFFLCERVVNCIADNNGGDGFRGAIFAENCESKNNTGRGFRLGFLFSNCRAIDNGGDGFFTETFPAGGTNPCISNCFSQGNGGQGFDSFNDVSSCHAIGNTLNGFYRCKEISASDSEGNTLDGFDDCENIVGCRAENNSQNGFDNSIVLGFNRSVGNTVSQYSATAFVDRAGTVVPADTAAGGFNG